MATRRSIQANFNALKMGGRAPLAARCCAVNEETALCDNMLAGLQIAHDLDEIAVDESGFDLPEFDRFVVMGDPDANLVGFVDQGLLRHRGRGVIALGIARDGREHLVPEYTVP